MNNKLTGTRLNFYPDTSKGYWIFPIEGWPYQVSKKEYLQYCEDKKKLWDCLIPKLDEKKIGVPLVFGTGGNIGDYNKGLEDIFMNPEKYDLKPFDDKYDTEIAKFYTKFISNEQQGDKSSTKESI